MKNFTINLTLKNDLSEIKKISDAIDLLASRYGLSAEMKNDINVALEEAVANIIYYGYDDKDQHLIGIEIDGKNNEVVLKIEDDGSPFNPLEEEPPKTNLPLKERPVGGLGIHLMRNSVDYMDYRREGKKNILTLKKTI